MATQEQIESYFSERLNQYYSWYDKKSIWNKQRYQRGRLIAAVSAVLIPVITNLDLPLVILGKTFDLGDWIVTLLGITVALSVALEGVYHYREQWVNFRSTAEYINTQGILFRHKAVDFKKLGDEEAFTLLISRVEKAISDENSVTLNILTRTDQQSKESE